MSMHPSCKPKELDEKMEKLGWTKSGQDNFGDDHFNYGKYPESKAPNAMFGFITYANNA